MYMQEDHRGARSPCSDVWHRWRTWQASRRIPAPGAGIAPSIVPSSCTISPDAELRAVLGDPVEPEAAPEGRNEPESAPESVRVTELRAELSAEPGKAPPEAEEPPPPPPPPCVCGCCCCCCCCCCCACSSGSCRLPSCRLPLPPPVPNVSARTPSASVVFVHEVHHAARVAPCTRQKIWSHLSAHDGSFAASCSMFQVWIPCSRDSSPSIGVARWKTRSDAAFFSDASSAEREGLGLF